VAIFHLLAGPNGAGKSSLYRALVADGIIDSAYEFVNADLFERAHLGHIADPMERSEAARHWANGKRETLMQSQVSFVSETVFSHTSKIELITRAQQLEYAVVLYVVAVEKPESLIERVKQRVNEGGHAVPTEKILSRYPRTLANLAKAIPLADAAYLYDSRSDADGGLQHVATCVKGLIVERLNVLPAWAKTVLSI